MDARHAAASNQAIETPQYPERGDMAWLASTGLAQASRAIAPRSTLRHCTRSPRLSKTSPPRYATAVSDTPNVPAPKPKREMGIMGILGLAIGGGCLLFALVGSLNTAFDWGLVLRISGSRVPLPDSWDVVIGLAGFGVLLVGLTFFGSFVTGKFKDAKGKPLVRVGIIVTAVGLLVLFFRALQIILLTNTYGSMLAYYATDGDLEDLQAEIDKGPTPEQLDDAMGRASQYNNGPALELLIKAGANFEDASGGEYKRCVIHRDSELGFIKSATELGATPQNCPDSAELIHRTVKAARDDADTAARVELLVAAGWDPNLIPEGEKQSALEHAKSKELPATVLALEKAGAKPSTSSP